MRKLIVFNNVSLDGYFTDAKGRMDFARNNIPDADWDAFVAGNASGSGGILILGRITYDLMASFWPTPFALENMPLVARRMNEYPKLVFSRTMEKADWSNTRVTNNDPAVEIQRLKNEAGEGMMIFGSGSIITQLAPRGLIDEYQIIVNPVVLGGGRTMFEGIREMLHMELIKSRTFANGNVLLCYEQISAG